MREHTSVLQRQMVCACCCAHDNLHVLEESDARPGLGQLTSFSFLSTQEIPLLTVHCSAEYGARVSPSLPWTQVHEKHSKDPVISMLTKAARQV